MNKAFVIFSINIILGIISNNAMAINWGECSDSLKNLEGNAESAKISAGELKKVISKIDYLEIELNRCTSYSTVNCNSIKSQIDDLTLKYNKLATSHTAKVASVGFDFANMQINCDYNFNLINIFDNKYENMECFRRISFMKWYTATYPITTKQSAESDNYIMNKTCIEKKQGTVNFCNKCFPIP